MVTIDNWSNNWSTTGAQLERSRGQSQSVCSSAPVAPVPYRDGANWSRTTDPIFDR
jgi:hypothetical protein